jgi:succinoglycan biosynthesis protein ExoA
MGLDADTALHQPMHHPPVSVIMTALEERRHLAEAVRSVFAQDYPGPLELVVAVGPSRDNTRALADELARQYPRMQVVDNPTGRTPAGLNLAIAATDPTSSVIVRTDGHAQLPPDYVRIAVADLQRTGAANVGGMMIPQGTTPFESAVARAMSERIGIGPVAFHTGGSEGPAPTVYLGVFRRGVLEATGGFDEHFSRAQDWELNHRIRSLGETVWFDPRLRVGYRPRAGIRALAKQFRGSGMWRWQIIRAYPETVSLRYLAAPLTTLAIGTAVGVLVVNAVAVHSVALGVAAAAVPIGYLAVVVAGGAATRGDLNARASLLYPVALVTMHMSWGAGFLRGAAGDAARALRGRFGRKPAGVARVPG